MMIKKIMYRILYYLFTCLPPTSDVIYSVCRNYVNRYNGENNHDIHTNGEYRVMNDVLPTFTIVFDVGANVGDWTSLALNSNPTLNIHCFEPSGATFQQLLAKQFPRNVVCNNVGLGAESSDQILHIFEPGSGLNSLYKREGLLDGWGLSSQSITETIKLISLDEYCAKNNIVQIDYLKLDVEGYEIEVLHGATEMFSQKRIKLVQFEYGGCNIDARVLLKDLFQFFSSFPYDLYKIYPKELRKVPRYDQRLENFQYQNWVAILGDHQ